MKILIEFESLDEAAEFLEWKRINKENKIKTPIERAGLQVRTANHCVMQGFKFLEDAQARSDVFWLQVPNFGKRSLRDLRDARPRLLRVDDISDLL